MKKQYTIASDAVIFFKNPFEPSSANTVANALAEATVSANGTPKDLAKVISRAHDEGLMSYLFDKSLTEEEGMEVIQRLKRATR